MLLVDDVYSLAVLAQVALVVAVATPTPNSSLRHPKQATDVFQMRSHATYTLHFHTAELEYKHISDEHPALMNNEHTKTTIFTLHCIFILHNLIKLMFSLSFFLEYMNPVSHYKPSYKTQQ